MSPLQSSSPPLTFIDLFCGCGGFSLGLQRAGLRCLAAIDSNREAISTFQANFGNDVLTMLEDLEKFEAKELAKKLGVENVDIIIGGPPCQGFSNVRQVDSANHGPRVRRDGRRYLFRRYLDFVGYFKPKIFVMENVLGIQTAAKGKFFTMVQAEARELGYRVQAQVEEAWKLGVPQKRRRQLIIGVRDEIAGYFPSELRPAQRVIKFPSPTLWDAIGDLTPLDAGKGAEEQDYDIQLRKSHVAERGNRADHYIQTVAEVGQSELLTGHKARPHSARDLRDFARLKEGEHSGEAEKRGVKMEFQYDRSCFKDRYKRHHREELCATIVAHLAKDGLGFIHPTQNRSFTPRETARIQSFPDSFLFPVARTHQFRLIGNAVPPLVAEAVGEEIIRFLEHNSGMGILNPVNERKMVPTSAAEAITWLQPLLKLPPGSPRELTGEAFRRAWFAVAYLYGGLHPDNALDHGKKIIKDQPEEEENLVRFEPRLRSPYYERSGWPVVLAPLAKEAWRRYRKGELEDEEFYCAEAQLAGIQSRIVDFQAQNTGSPSLGDSPVHALEQPTRNAK